MKISNQFLARQPFLVEMPAEFLPLVNHIARIESFHEGEQIFHQGHRADAFYLLTKGRVELETPYVPGEGMLNVKTLQAGEALGWSWFFAPYRWQFSARAIAPAEALVIDAAALRDAADREPRFGYWLARRIGEMLMERLHCTRQRLLEACESPLQPL